MEDNGREWRKVEERLDVDGRECKRMKKNRRELKRVEES